MMETIYDSKGTLITIGARVVEHAPDPSNVGQTDGPTIEVGTVVRISDADGDTNSYGELVGIAPRVTVNYDDGSIEHWTASWNATGPWDDSRTDYTCDDVEVAS